MAFIILSVIQSVLILATFKIFERYRVDNLQAIVINYLTAAAFGFAIAFPDRANQPLPQHDWLTTAVALGVLFICTFFFFALSSQKAGMAVTSVTAKMSLVIPVIVSAIFWEEPLNGLRIIGILLALAAFYLIFRKNEPVSLKARYAYLPILVFTGNGVVDTTMKFADREIITDDLVYFLSFVFATGFIIGSVILAIRIMRKKTSVNYKSIAGGVFLGMINFGSTYYMLKAISVFESSVVFPVTNASIVGLSGLTGYFIFREKLSWLNWTGIFVAVLSILIIAKA